MYMCIYGVYDIHIHRLIDTQEIVYLSIVILDNEGKLVFSTA